jgi:hypothetical protein
MIIHVIIEIYKYIYSNLWGACVVYFGVSLSKINILDLIYLNHNQSALVFAFKKEQSKSGRDTKKKKTYSNM